MRSIINELWHGNIIPQEDSRNNTKEMKELLGYMSRHHEDLEKSFTDEQKEIFEKFHDCWSEYMSLGEAAILSMLLNSVRELCFRLRAKGKNNKLFSRVDKSSTRLFCNHCIVVTH